MVKGFVLIISLFFFVSCMKKTFVVLPEYEGKTIGNVSLYVKVCDPPIIENPDDVLDDLGEGVPVRLYNSLFYSEFPKAILNVTTFNKIYVDTTENEIQLKEITESLTKKEKIRIKVPQGINSSFNEKTHDYSLLIQNLKIYRKEAQSGTWTPGAPGTASTYSGGSFPELVHVGKYVIWDNKLDKLVSYGLINTGKSFAFVMQKSTWEGSILNLVKSVFVDRPFKRPGRTKR